MSMKCFPAGMRPALTQTISQMQEIGCSLSLEYDVDSS